MAYKYATPNLTGGIDDALIDVSSAVPSFLIGLLLFVWSFVFLSGMAAQSKRRGSADAPLWATMASISTLMLTLVLSLKAGLVSLDVLGIVVGVTLLSGLWLFLSKGRGEL